MVQMLKEGVSGPVDLGGGAQLQGFFSGGQLAMTPAGYLLNRKRKEITRLEEGQGIQVNIASVPGASPELLEFVCYDKNNNEIKVLPFEEPAPRRR